MFVYRRMGAGDHLYFIAITSDRNSYLLFVTVISDQLWAEWSGVFDVRLDN